jgi:2,3-bisphosphoglycerate-independent phosphoglycerate mutase
MKALIVICDGMGDRPIKKLGNKTPLEAADTPNMDELASMGINGIMYPIAPGIRAGSDTSHLAILGFNPYEVYTGRGPFEAAGMGLTLKPGDIAFRCNFATVNDDLVVEDRRAGRIKDTEKLAEAIRDIKLPDVEIFFKSLGYRGALVLRGEGLSYRVSDSDPHFPGRKVEKVRALDGSEEAKRTAELINKFTEEVREVLRGKEANMLLVRGCGIAPNLPSLKEKYGISGACMATTAIIKGIARSVGMEIIEAEEDYVARSQQVLNELKKVDLFLMNIKEADEAGHDHNPERKIMIIEKIDNAIGKFLNFASENYVILMADHTTPCSFGDHTGDSVPITIAGPEVRTDNVTKFDERSNAMGALGVIRGTDIMQIILNLMNKTEKFGA